MLKQHLKTALRSIRLNGRFSLINITGLTVGLTAAIILLAWVHQQSDYDSFHGKADRIFKLNASFTADGHATTFRNVPGAVAFMATHLKDVQAVNRIYEKNDQTLSTAQKGKVFGGLQIGYIDSSFLQIFDFKILNRKAHKILPGINTVALTEQTARKLFGNLDPLNKIVVYQEKAFTVSAVLHDFPQNSSLHYDALLPMANYDEIFKTRQGDNGQSIDQNFNIYSFSTYLLLKEQADPKDVGLALSSAFGRLESSADIHIRLQNIRQIHLVTADGNDSALQMVHIMLIVALTILLIASFNFINLSMARSLVKSRQLAVRKISAPAVLTFFCHSLLKLRFFL